MDVTHLGADLLKLLQEKGWKLQLSTSCEPLLPPAVRQRYPRVPGELTDFLETIDSCANAAENAWFLCRADYRRTDEQGFRWNEFELMGLDTDNVEWQAQARNFWDFHLPFMLSVHSDYDFLAVSLDERSYGLVVHGHALEFEQTSVVAHSFAQFLTSFTETVAGRRDDYPLSYFV